MNMNAQTIRNIVRNATEHDGGMMDKSGSVWNIYNAKSPETIISTVFNAIPINYELERGTTINGKIWFKIWAPISADFTVLHFYFD